MGKIEIMTIIEIYILAKLIAAGAGLVLSAILILIEVINERE
jgi:hypothetical protein